jgi:uncharacterized RDD family membrane protein YckC
LIEFPRKTRQAEDQETSQSSLPAWRVELNEKVRAIKAKRDVNSAALAAPSELEVPEPDADLTEQASHSPADRDAAPALSSRAASRANNTIVEAALTRVRRASENASRASLPKIESARPLGTLALDKEATARALEPMVETSPKAPPAASPVVSVSEEFAHAAGKADYVNPKPYKERTAAAAATAVKTVKTVRAPIGEDEPGTITAIDEIEPVDYLEREIKKQALSSEFLRNESPSLFTHAVLGAVDILTIAVSCAPFAALIEIVNGNLSQSRLAAGLMVLLVTFFYLAITQCLCGKTFGMMLTNTRVVDAYTFESPSPQRMLARTAGYFLALAPALLGFVWMLFNRKRRGWHDIISGTLVARDF